MPYKGFYTFTATFWNVCKVIKPLNKLLASGPGKARRGKRSLNPPPTSREWGNVLCATSELLLTTYLTLIYPLSTSQRTQLVSRPHSLASFLQHWLVTLCRCSVVLQVMGKIFCLTFLSLVVDSLCSQLFPAWANGQPHQHLFCQQAQRFSSI